MALGRIEELIRRSDPSRRPVRGFTLIEVLVTVALMGIVLPVALRGISIATSSARYARNAAEAATLGQTKLNEIVALIQIQQSNSLGSTGDFGNLWPQYTWVFEEISNTELACIEATLAVLWNEPAGPRMVRLSTIIQDPVAAADAAAAAAEETE